ncbi:hypothetical protein [Streptomyces sp. NPDC046976]|uniref:hypothetical protein n=1 Tax=Streptomyces sp. NPDC046976 TaxID=3155258 RepID=UPI0033E155C2
MEQELSAQVQALVDAAVSVHELTESGGWPAGGLACEALEAAEAVVAALETAVSAGGVELVAPARAALAAVGRALRSQELAPDQDRPEPAERLPRSTRPEDWLTADQSVAEVLWVGQQARPGSPEAAAAAAFAALSPQEMVEALRWRRSWRS